MKWLIALILLSLSGAVAAQGPYFMIGGSRIEISDNVTFDESETSLNASFGYSFNPYFGLQLDYYDLGDFSAGPATLKSQAIGGSIVATIMFNSVFGVYGKVGIASLEAELNAGGIGSKEDTSTGYGGAGLELRGERAGVYLEYMFFDDDSAKFDVASLGLKVRF